MMTDRKHMEKYMKYKNSQKPVKTGNLRIIIGGVHQFFPDKM